MTGDGWMRRRLTEAELKHERIVLFEDGFGVDGLRIEGREVVHIEAFKQDCFTFDRICLWFKLSDGSGVVISEDQVGYLEAEDAMHKALGFDNSWRDKVVLPPFEECRTVLYEK
jgi:hypothetical protein